MRNLYLTGTSLLYGLHSWGEAYLIPTWLMREQAGTPSNQSMYLTLPFDL